MADRLPLDAFRVLDLTQFLAGPYCTMVLGDLGAAVTKIERFPEGDHSRRMAPVVNGESYPFMMANRNKRSVALNLRTERGREIFLRLAEDCDAVVENFRPGVAAELGIDHASVQGVNPSVIYCSISGFGQTGPHRNRAGLDIIAQGMSGFMYMNGSEPDTPAKVGIAISDIAAGSTAVYSILAAHIHRLAGGGGQKIDISLLDAGLAWTLWEAGAYFGSGELPVAAGTRHRRSCPYQAYRTRDGYVTVGANTESLWRRFCTAVIERPELLDDPRYQDLPGRMRHVDALERDIEAVLRAATTDHWVARLERAGVPGGPVLRYDQALASQHASDREMVVSIDHPRVGAMRSLGIPAKLSGTPLRIRSAAPYLGQHTGQELRRLGFADAQIAALHAGGIVYDPELEPSPAVAPTGGG